MTFDLSAGRGRERGAGNEETLEAEALWSVQPQESAGPREASPAALRAAATASSPSLKAAPEPGGLRFPSVSPRPHPPPLRPGKCAPQCTSPFFESRLFPSRGSCRLPGANPPVPPPDHFSPGASVTLARGTRSGLVPGSASRARAHRLPAVSIATSSPLRAPGWRSRPWAGGCGGTTRRGCHRLRRPPPLPALCSESSRS